MIVLWSAASIESDWVRDEAAQGRDRHRLVPLSLDGSRAPLGFRQYQVIDLSHWHGRKGTKEMIALERAIAAAVSGKTAPSLRLPRACPARPFLIGGTGRGRGGRRSGWALACEGSRSVWRTRRRGSQPRRRPVPQSQRRFLARLSLGWAHGRSPCRAHRINALHVLAATSSTKAAEHDDDPKSVARQLEVAYILSGLVQRAGDVVRIFTELTDGNTGFSKWSQSVHRKITDIFAVESEIAGTVAQAMSVQVATTEPAPGGTTNVQAYEDYLRGKALSTSPRTRRATAPR